ncbi:MAG: hypothetical protein ACPLW8_02015 [Candidatus Bathyarchaeales archaeon]
MDRKNLLFFYVVSLVLVLEVFALYLPWWTIRTSNEAEVVVRGVARVDINLWQRVMVFVSYNRTRCVAFDISEFVSNEADLSAFRNLFSVTSILAVAGFIFVLFIWVLSIFAVLKRPLLPLRLFNLLIVVSFVLILAAPFYMFNSFYPLITKLERFTYFDFPSGWVQISPRNVNGFWGALSVPAGSGLPSYLVGFDFWVWGPGGGWILSFAAALLLVSLFLLSREMAPKKAF